ncbi:carboxy terminal-processing peptidase [Pelomonas parva]|uniref:Carboxy terminal-processing peptidase n=1 Tax=Pelomonas parva TaxID=3299032 RepID=A0ABW7F1N2_9BURK
MRYKLLGLVLAVAGAMPLATADTELAFPPLLEPAAQDAKAARLAADLLSRYHYKAMPLDDTLSSQVFDQYLKLLDPEKLYFLRSDIDRLAADRTRLDDAILNEDLRTPFAIFNLYERRAAERMAFARSLLAGGFDFERNETLMIDRKDQPWPATETEALELWRKRVKNDWLRLRLAGRDDAAIRKLLDKRYDNNAKRLAKINSADAFEAFMNAYTTAIEPHTNYLGPRAAENFDIAMRLSLVGIGAALTEHDGHITVRELVAGGPAMVSGQLQVGDRIVGVGQGPSGSMEDVVGWRLDDVVALIRGKAASTVRLDILPAGGGPDAPAKTIALVRDTIKMQDSAAKAKVYSVTSGEGKRRVGVITLPSFYEDVAAMQKGDKDYRSAARDVARLLQDLKAQQVDGVLMDLRNNGGGSLREAVALTGLFLGKVPVVQTRNAKGDVSVATNSDTAVAWQGPLAVLINRGSASASEIFAAAVQDYGRGLVIGEPSFGKGTVQTVARLDQIARNPKPTFGDLKLTIAQFFRVNGGTTQLHGVMPDMRVPALGDDSLFGESSFGNALPWTRIPAVDHQPVGDLKPHLPRLKAWHESRVQRDRDYQDLVDDLAKARAQRKNNVISLNEDVRRKERAAQEKRLVALLGGAAASAASAAGGTLADDGLQFNERQLARNLASQKARDDANDVILNEAVNIVSDSVALKAGKSQVAASVSSTRPTMIKDLLLQGSSEQ